MQISTSGGVKETDVKELMVKPSGTPPAPVTDAMATPVEYLAQTRRKVNGLRGENFIQGA